MVLRRKSFSLFDEKTSFSHTVTATGEQIVDSKYNCPLR